jgi:hypothetical protein
LESKIEHAKELFELLRTELEKFNKANPYQVATKIDPQTQQLIYYVDKSEDVPEKIPLLAGDIVQNLRSALDHLAYGLFIHNSGITSNARHVCFPVAADLQKYEARKINDTRGISNSAISLIDAIKPYKGENDTIWRIHELNNIDKHRTLVTVGSSFQSMDIGAHMIAAIRALSPKHRDIPDMPLFLKPADNLFPLKPGSELFIDEPNAEPNPKMQFRFNVVFNEQDIVTGEPIIDVIQSMIDGVTALAPVFSAELGN